ncbi:MAG: hypothetical protein WC712_02390 [Candidatus Brocadiia bacterium]
MTGAFIRLFHREYSGLAGLVLAAAAVGVLFGAFYSPDIVAFFALSLAVIFGSTAGGFFRSSRRLEFLLTRNVTRRAFFLLRWVVGLVPVLIAALLASSCLVFPLSSDLWSFFVESGLTAATLSGPGGWGWLAFCVLSSGWAYTVTFVLVSRTRDESELFIALLLSVAVCASAPAAFWGLGALGVSGGLFPSDSLYSPSSTFWISYYIAAPLLAAVALTVGLRLFERTDV